MSIPNRLYFGDCLDVMREDIPDESVDLIYLDPPFNSKRLYNAFIGGAQWVAFDDTWRWSEAVDDFHDVASQPTLARTMEGLRLMLGEGANLAYLSYMANRLVECHRVLKPTGSIYLHCDPTFSHYLKAVMDGIFGVRNFRSDITWRRINPTGRASKRYANNSDSILYYAKNDRFTWNQQFGPHREEYVASAYKYVEDDTGRRYRLDNLKGAGLRNGASGQSWRGVDPSETGSHWAVPNATLPESAKSLSTQEKLDILDSMGRIYWPPTGKVPSYKRYLDEMPGTPIDTIWDDIRSIGSNAKERLGYPTQKPLALLERILRASSNEGDVVLDPFCGCGTTVEAAQRLGRRWIGVDICVNACKVIERRIRAHFDSLWDDVEFIGMPKTASDAKTLASLDAFRFERWAASLVDGMEANTRQRGDNGIDGWGRLPIRKGRFIDLVSQVKGGSTGPGDVQAFNGARQQAGADLGIFTCFDDRVTQGMRDAAASAGRFMETPVVQIYTVEDYFAERVPRLPRVA